MYTEADFPKLLRALTISEQTILSPSNPSVTGGQRFHELDSLRGLAALVVVFHHFRYMWLYPEPQSLTLKNALLYPLFAGRESVVLFFLLSGFVLSIPYLRGRGQSYATFMTRRVLRIYCPYLFGLALAVAGNAVWHGSLGISPWADPTWATPVSWRPVLLHVFMVGDTLRFNTAFWSLFVEMRVSIVFPFLFLFIRKVPTAVAFLTAAACWPVVEYTYRRGVPLAGTVEFVAIFIVGILMAMHLSRLGGWFRRLGVWQRLALGLGSFVLFDLAHVLVALAQGNRQIPELFQVWEDWPIAAGAAGLMLVALESAPARRFLNSTVPRFLGRISYSLYLVHGTVLFAMTYLLVHKVSTPVAFLVFLPAALLLSTAFCFWIEEPFLRLGRRLGRSAA